MPHLDEQTQEVVVRFAYDGAAGSGKTTSIRALAGGLLRMRAGAVESPGSTGQKTAFFDWCDVDGGVMEGRRWRCQIVSVPGDPHLQHRRQRILADADAVVFVLDPDPARLPLHEKVASSLRDLCGARPVPIVVEVNKSDLYPDADVAGLAAAVGFAAAPVFVACAEANDGVSHVFLSAIRLANAQLRAALSEGAMVPAASPSSAHALYRELADTTHQGLEPPTTEGVLSTWPQPLSEALWRQLASGWAPSSSSSRCPWGPLGAQEWRGEASVLHTCDAWAKTTRQEAQALFSRVVREQSELGTGGVRHLVLSVDGSYFRLWALTLNLETLASALVADGGAHVVERLTAAWISLRDVAHLLDLEVDRIAHTDDGWLALGFPGDEAPVLEAPALPGLDVVSAQRLSGMWPRLRRDNNAASESSS